MREKNLSCMLAIILLLLCIHTSAIADSGKPKSIEFRGIPWYESLANVREKLATMDGFIPSQFFPMSEHVRIESWDGYYYKDSELFVKDGGVSLHFSEAPIAGYLNSLSLYFLYPINGEQINSHPDDAQLCKATYKFSEDIDNLEAVYFDLQTKLKNLYGDGQEELDDSNSFTGINVYTATLWTAEDGSLVYLIMSRNSLSGKACQVRLVYAAGDINEKITTIKRMIDKGVVPEDHTIIVDPENHEGL